jgi:hypothetical protein
MPRNVAQGKIGVLRCHHGALLAETRRAAGSTQKNELLDSIR